MPVSALAQEVIEVDVAFYDAAEREKLIRYPTGAVIQQLASAPVEVPMSEFLTYYLFHRQKLGIAGYRDYRTIEAKLNVALASLDGCLTFNGHSISTPAEATRQLTEVSEHIGEAVGLAVTSRIHHLTSADWTPIPEQHGRGAAPTFDFQIASDGHHYVQLESKGSSVPDNRIQTDAVTAQYRRIVEKKGKLRERALIGKDPHPAAFRYGTITAVDPRAAGNVRCWLTDPPPTPADETPERYQLLQRVRFLRDWISVISARSQLAAALATRVAALEALLDPFELSGVPLRKGNGEQFGVASYQATGVHSTFLANKSRVTDGPAGGSLLQLSTEALFLAGIREDLLALAAEQNFERIATYQARSATIEKEVRCVVPRARRESFRLPPSIREAGDDLGGNLVFVLKGHLHYSSSGLVFGVLPLPEN